MLKNFQMDDVFFNQHVRLVKDVVIPYQEKVLKDEADVSEKSRAINNFELAAEKIETGACHQEFYGMVFQDSDVAKWLEAAAYSLNLFPDLELEERCDAIIALIGRAQWKDGYLNTYFTVKEPEKRWTNLEEAHELYCAGHMMEAAAAYYKVTGKSNLLDIMKRMADHMYQHFIVEKAEGFPGHPEVELGLIRLYEATSNENYKTLAMHFVDNRGVDSSYYEKEKKRTDWSVWGGRNTPNLEYSQAHAPVREQNKAVGHAVRAVYLYSGMADVARYTKDPTLINACKTLWNSIVNQRMYITGSIGSAYEGEAFTKDYHLPNDTAYAETCAAIGLIYFARRMLELNPSSEYADIMEKALYNTVLPGMSLDGTKFFYVNPLEVIPGISGESITHRHARPVRPDWFACACCPPNVARLLPSIGRYAWGQTETTVYSHLFVGGTIDLAPSIGGKIVLQSSLPYEGAVEYRFLPDEKEMFVNLAIRKPYWSDLMNISLNGKVIDGQLEQGYIYIPRTYSSEDVLKITFDMDIKTVFAHTKINANSQKMAIQRGPLIYCAEGIDNEEHVLSLSIKKDSKKTVLSSDLFGGTKIIQLEGVRKESSTDLYSFTQPKEIDTQITLIPYFLWSNRGLNEMRIWMPYI